MAHSQWDLSGKPGDPDLRIGGYTTATAAEGAAVPWLSRGFTLSNFKMVIMTFSFLFFNLTFKMYFELLGRK